MEHIRVPRIDHVQWMEARRPRRHGTIHLTTSHLLFVDSSNQEDWVLHSHIGVLERIGSSQSSSNLLKLKLKIHRVFTLLIPATSDFTNLILSLQYLSRPNTIVELYAFIYPGTGEAHDKSRKNAALFDMEREYRRQGVGSANSSDGQAKFQISDMNRQYDLCSTYPAVLAFPAQSLPHTITGSARFRSRNRLPALTFFHKSSGGSIHRCSQPLSGLQNNRSAEDEGLCQQICNSSNKQPYILDTRPRLNAMANRAQGKGYEDERFYRFAKVMFLPIENIHVVRSSLEKFIDVVDSSKSFGEFYSNMMASGWMTHLSAIMTSSIGTAEKVAAGGACILHCSDGWDRTSQVGSMAQLLLDPYYRTFTGFLMLIEKDWIKFGHQFQHRLGHTNPVVYTPSHGAQNLEQEASPVFGQWLELVYHLLRVFPEEFEFNEDLLIEIFFHATGCQFGNFLANCDKDRQQFQKSTYCLWEYLIANRARYQPKTSAKPSKKFMEKVKECNLSTPWRMWSFWENMYRQKGFQPDSSRDVSPAVTPVEEPKPDTNQLAVELGYCTVEENNNNKNKVDAAGRDLDPLGIMGFM